MKKQICLLLSAVAAASALSAVPHARRHQQLSNLYKRHNVQQAREYHRSVGNATEYFLEGVPVNHFTTNNTDPLQTYKMRYIIDESHVKENAANPPILFYCGNEGDVWTFYNNTGFVTQNLSAAFNAVVLFGEHRYYGESLPFGDQSFTSRDTVKYLTVDQTMMDYVHLIQHIKNTNPNYKYSPVFAFGGSYGGMLAAWFRMKYPHVIQGAHASSAPILFFPGSVSPYAFNELVTRQYDKYCPGIKKSTYLGF